MQIAIIFVLCHEKGILGKKKNEAVFSLISTKRLAAGVQKVGFFSSAASHAFSSPTSQKSTSEITEELTARKKYRLGNFILHI